MFNGICPLFGLQCKRGFTLLELSLVLVIMGLLVSAVLVGKELIHQSELRSISSDIDGFIAATNTFRLKYNGLPGDIINATSFFGEADPNPVTCKLTPTLDIQTCNGDGNNKVNNGTNEMFRYWQQLASAGLVRGKYTGIAGTANAWDTEAGINAPASKMSKVTYLVRDEDVFAGNGSDFATYMGRIMSVGLESEGVPQGRFLAAPEAYAIDVKIDDGKPGRGKLIASHWSTCTNAVANNDLDTTYKTDQSTIACGLIYNIGY